MPRHKSTESTRVAGAVPAGEPAFYPQEDFPRGILDGDFVRYDADTELWERQSALDFIAEFTASFSGGGSYDQDLNTDDSPAFVTVKLTGLTDGRIPYHVNDATGLADGPLKTDVDDAVSKAHAAGSDNQDLSGLVEKVAGHSLVADTEIAKIHAAGSDDQDLSGLVTKEATSPDPTGYLPEYDATGNLVKSSKLSSDVHAALTIDGTSPLSLSGQAISIKNDAAGAITEVDTGTLDNSATKVPVNKTVYDAIGANHIAGLTVTVKPGGGGDFTTIQAAINFFRLKSVTGTNTIQIDPGTYNETLIIRDILLSGTLILQGDTRGLAGVSWVNGVVNYHNMERGGSGTFTMTRGGDGNKVLTVTGSTGNPNFSGDGWVSGDKVLVYTGTTPNTIVEMTLASVSNNTLTATGAWPDPAPATSGAGYTIALQPNVKIAPSSPTSHTVYIVGQNQVQIKGLYVYPNTSTYYGVCVSHQSVAAYHGILTRGARMGVAIDASTFKEATATSRLTVMDSPDGVSGQNYTIIGCNYSVVVKATTEFGYFVGYHSLLRAAYSHVIKCPKGYYAYGMSFVFAPYSNVAGCTTAASPANDVIGNANSFMVRW